MSRFIVIGDVHLADKGPSLRYDTYPDEILAKLEFCVEKALEEGCDGIVQLGDLWHIKTPGRTSHALVQRCHAILSRMPTWIVTGNHDIQNDRLDSLPAQPLGSLLRMSNMYALHNDDSSYRTSGSFRTRLPIYGIEYLQDWSTLPKRLAKFVDWANENYGDAPVMLAMHAPIFPSPKDPPYDYISAPDLAALLEDRDGHTTVAYGHIHDPEGDWSESGYPGVTFANYGAISRGSLHIETLKRQPRAYVWDSETGDIKPFDIPCKPVEQVFDLSGKQADEQHHEKMTAFLQVVTEDEKSYASLDDLIGQLSTEATEDDGDMISAAIELLEFAKDSQ